MSFKAATWNVSGQLRLEWASHEVMSVETLYHIFPDIIGFQEFGETCHHAYHPRLPHLQFSFGAPARDIFINTIAWNGKRFQYRSSGIEWLSDTPEIMSKGWDGSERGMSWVRLADRENNNRELLHINVHLDNIGEQARVKGTEQILRFVDQQPKDLPILVTGDFNCSPEPAPQGKAQYSRVPYDLFLQSGFTHAWRDKHPTKRLPTTFHNREGKNYRGDEYAMWHLDWIMVRNLRVLACDIVQFAKHPIYPSDHYPVEGIFDYL